MMQTVMSKERKLQLELVRNLGDNKHNCALRRGGGEIIYLHTTP